MSALFIGLVAFVGAAALAMAAMALLGTPVAVGAEAPLLESQRAAPAMVGRVAALTRPKSEGELDALRRHLVQAGLRDGLVLERYLASRAVLAVLLPAVGYLTVAPKTALLSSLLILLLGGVGYYLPSVLVDSWRSARQREILTAFPNALDMLVSCLEAGLGLDAALQRVAADLRDAAPILAAELSLTVHESAAGLPRADVMRRLSDRVGLDEVSSLVNALSQAERYGSGIAGSIRAHAQLVRHRRVLRAEKSAARAGPKLTVAMIFFILPALFVVLIGPTIVNIATHLLPTLNASAGQ